MRQVESDHDGDVVLRGDQLVLSKPAANGKYLVFSEKCSFILYMHFMTQKCNK